MRLLSPVFLLLLCLFETNCQSQRENAIKQDSVIHIKYSYKAEFLNQTNLTTIPVDGYTYLSYRNEKIVMRIPIPLLPLIQTKTDSGIVYTDDEQLPIDTNFDYVLITLPDSNALFYKSDSLSKVGIKIKGDSMYRNRIPPLPNIIDPRVDSLVEVREVNGLRDEIYVARNKPDDSYPDSVIISFSKFLNHVPFSFSSTLDSSRRMKLYRIRFITNSMVDRVSKKTIPWRELSFEIKIMNSPADIFLHDLLE